MDQEQTTALLRRITVVPDLLNGRPTIRGLRISVETVLDFLAAGDTPEEILAQYPSLERDDIAACLQFASEVVKQNYNVRPAA